MLLVQSGGVHDWRTARPKTRATPSAGDTVKPFTFEAPIKTKSPNGSHGHWKGRMTRTRLERGAIAYTFPAGGRGLLNRFPKLSVLVHLTRLAPSRGLDFDNLVSSFKATRDEVANQLGLDDRDERIQWDYSQERGKWGVRIRIEPVPTTGVLNRPELVVGTVKTP